MNVQDGDIDDFLAVHFPYSVQLLTLCIWDLLLEVKDKICTNSLENKIFKMHNYMEGYQNMEQTNVVYKQYVNTELKIAWMS